jgi:hypothetical protein
MITTGYWLDGRGWISGRGKRFSSIQWVLGALSMGIKRLGREADPSPPSCEDVKNGGAVPSFLHTYSWRAA